MIFQPCALHLNVIIVFLTLLRTAEARVYLVGSEGFQLFKTRSNVLNFNLLRLFMMSCIGLTVALSTLGMLVLTIDIVFLFSILTA